METTEKVYKLNNAEIIDIVEMNESYKPVGKKEEDLLIYGESVPSIGYKIILKEESWYFIMSNDRNCCEEWGYSSSNDNPKDFVGAKIREIAVTQKAGRDDNNNVGGYKDTEFVTTKTDRGDFQIAYYTASWSGYYGHDVAIKRMAN